MPGFLRRKTSPSKTVDTETPSKKSSSSDAPPSLPPLFPSRTSHTSSFRKEPESDMAPVLSPSQPAPPKENGAAGDSVLLPDITPLHSSLDVDTDWQDLLRFIDSPSLLGDSSSQETKPSTASEKHKRSSTPGVALVTSNRYLSNAQKTRMAQERGLKLSESAEPPRRVSPHGDRLKKDECEDVSKSNHATSRFSSALLNANHANLRHRISSIMEDQQDATTDENQRVGTANVSTYKEAEPSKRREDAPSSQAPTAQLKFEASADTKPTRKDSKTSKNGNGSFFSKVIDIRDGRSGRSSAARQSDLPNGKHLADGSNVRPTADVTNGKQPTIDTPSNEKQETDTSNKKPVIDVADWLAGVKRVAKDGDVLGRATRAVSVIERSQSPFARSRSPQAPPPLQKPLSRSPPPTSRSPSSARSSPPNSTHRHSSAVQTTVAMPSVMTTKTTTAVMTNENANTKTRENAPGPKNEGAGRTTNKTMTSIRGRKTTQSVVSDGGKTVAPTTRDQERLAAGHLEQPQHHQRITQGQAHNNQVQAQQRSSNGHTQASHTHRRTASSESQGNKTHLNGHHSPVSASAQVNGSANVRLSPAPHLSAAPNSVPYPTPGFYPTTGYPPTSFCPSAYPNSFTPSFNLNPYNAAYGGMYHPFTPFQHFGLGPAYPSPFPSPSGERTNSMLDPNSSARNPQLHKAPSTASFFDAVMSGVSGIAGSQGLSGNSQQNPAMQRTTTRSMSGESTSSRDKDKPRVLTKVRPTPPPTPPHVAGSAHAGAHATGSGRTGHRRSGYDEDDRVREVCALLDSDPFAKVEGVRVVTREGRSGSVSGHGHGSLSGHGHGSISDHGHGSVSGHGHASISGHGRDTPARPLYFPSLDGHGNSSHAVGVPLQKSLPSTVAGMPVRESLREGKEGGDDVIEEVEEEEGPKTYFPLTAFLSNADFFARMMEYLEFRDWLALYAVGRGAVRSLFDSVAPSGPSRGTGKNVQCNARQFREIILERFLRPVGYVRWSYEWAEPIVLTLRDLNNYMRGISMPTHDYARFAHAYISQPRGASRGLGDVLSLALTTRAYTKVVLRLRAQAESEAKWITRLREEHVRTCSGCSPPNQATKAGGEERQAPSPSSSSPHHDASKANGHARQPSSSGGSMSSSSGTSSCACPLPRPSFQSPLFRPNRAALLRVFVPSPDGTWLSDVSVEECEAELRRSATGAVKLLRAGDVVWDIALGDEGNIGRMVWDGGYLVDLDYRYSRLGELSPYFHSLAFPPSYFHRVIRIGASAGHNPQANPIVYVDVSPWGQEIARNLQLLQERGKAETPHGALHDVVLWVHRSSFKIHPPPTTDHSRVHSHLREHFPHLVPRSERRAIPNLPGYFIDPNWYGTVVVEVEGTQEGLSDLQDRCGPGVFPPRPEAITGIAKGVDRRRIWRVIREKSRPGEIWLRVVREKERVTW